MSDRRPWCPRAAPGAALLALLSAIAGCAVLASKADYADYRAIRLASGDSDQLRAMRAYADRHPDGRWTDWVRAERESRESAVWDTSRSTREGLAFYLAVYPDGPHAAEARPRLAALQSVQGRRAQEQTQAGEVVAAREQELAERRRRWVTSATQFWTKTLISITNWGAPLSDVARRNSAFSRAFGQEPRPRCTRTECVKTYGAAFAIPVPGATRIERRIDLALRLSTPGGRLTRVEILLPGKGFSRWYELENRAPIVDEDPASRNQAVRWALERISAAVREASPGASAMSGAALELIAPLVAPAHPSGEGTPPAPGPETRQADGAPAPGDSSGTQEQAAGGPTPTAEDNAALEELLRRAAGQAETTTAGTPAPTPSEVGTSTVPAAPSALAPTVVSAWRAGALRIVAFTAAADDYSPGFDGVVLEIIP